MDSITLSGMIGLAKISVTTCKPLYETGSEHAEASCLCQPGCTCAIGIAASSLPCPGATKSEFEQTGLRIG